MRANHLWTHHVHDPVPMPVHPPLNATDAVSRRSVLPALSHTTPKAGAAGERTRLGDATIVNVGPLI